MRGLSDLRRTIYRLDASADDWMLAVCQAVATVMALPLGACLQLESLSDGERTTQVVATNDLEVDARALTERIAKEARQHTPRRSAPSVVTQRQLRARHTGDAKDWGEALLREAGAEDFLSVTAFSERSSLVFVAPLLEPVDLDGHDRMRWQWLAVHLVAASRLRRLAGAPVDLEAPGEKGAVSVEVPEGEDLWDALVDGSWSVSSSFSGGGRRVILARPTPEVVGPVVTERQEEVLRLAARGHSNKVIAYKLGLSASTVASHLKRGVENIGLSSRLDLIQVAHQLLGDPASSNSATDRRSGSIDFKLVEDALDTCAREISRLDPTRHPEGEYRDRIRELRKQLDLLDSLLANLNDE